MARGSRLELGDAPPTFPCASGATVVDVMDWSSSEPSAIRSFTAPKVHVVYAWERSETGVIGFQTCFEVNKTWHPMPDAGQPPDPMLDILQAEYGLTATSAEAQVSLWPDLADQAAREPLPPDLRDRTRRGGRKYRDRRVGGARDDRAAFHDGRPDDRRPAAVGRVLPTARRRVPA
jgi:hypothetical protein